MDGAPFKFRSSHVSIRSTPGLFPGFLDEEVVVGDIEACNYTLHIHFQGRLELFTVRRLDRLEVTDDIIDLILDIRTDEGEGQLHIRMTNRFELVLLLHVLDSASGMAAVVAGAAKRRYDFIVNPQSNDQKPQLQQLQQHRQPVRLGALRASDVKREEEEGEGEEEENREGAMENSALSGPAEPKKRCIARRITVTDSAAPPQKAPSMPNLDAASPDYRAEAAAAGVQLPPLPPASVVGNYWPQQSDAAAAAARPAAAAMASPSMQMLSNVNAQASASMLAPPPSPHPSQQQLQQNLLQGFNPVQQPKPSLIQILQHLQQQQTMGQFAGAQSATAATAASAAPTFSAAAFGLQNAGGQSVAFPQLQQMQQPQPGYGQSRGWHGKEEASETMSAFEEMARRCYRLDAQKRAQVLKTLKDFLHVSGV